jgi:tRNA pseudouridine55 synthase
METMLNGIINVYKEKGYTSFDVVAKLRGILKMKKIGHTGTLDPDAEGVLPVCLGKATKVCDLLTEKQKEYEAVLLLGKVTDTQDISGQVLRKCEVTAGEDEVREAILSFVGDYMQVPPMYSALKVNGKKLCDMAREGIVIERKARPVHIFSINILEMDLPWVKMRVECSKGTYIRTLCEDIGERLSCGGCMESLLRTRVSEFRVEDALTLSEIESRVKSQGAEIAPQEWETSDFDFIRSVDSVFLQYEKAVVKKEWNKLLYNGNRLPETAWKEEPEAAGSERIRVYDEEEHFIGLYEYQQEKQEYKPVKLFIET